MATIYHQNKNTAIHGSRRVARNIEGCHFFKKTIVFKLLPKLAKSSCGSTPLWYITKLTKKTWAKNAIEGH
jgi:hypothetical protein